MTANTALLDARRAETEAFNEWLAADGDTAHNARRRYLRARARIHHLLDTEDAS